MHIITEDVFLKNGLQTFIKQKKITLDNNDVILDFDNNFIIITTLTTLNRIIQNDNAFECYLLHSFLKIKKDTRLTDISRTLKYKSWRNKQGQECRIALTRKERMLLSHIISAGKKKSMLTHSGLDIKTVSTHKYNMLRKVNQPSIAALTQVHNRWENFRNQPAN
ncbi:hypothetical protein [Kosakonia sp. R1.Fl]|uniref:hypothetical protein n=1 Tax=Kosakonia sp. R1.Fl TaxID=2928706 RepID=UPI00201E525B|nr:hypothetical protein [Kosakonia sp. R1.Fl]MCL6743917.1 hypothetical protein [Kosakonia sp. R1.Fl]